MNIFKSLRSIKLKSNVTTNYSEEEKADTAIKISELALSEIVFQARDYLSEKDFEKLGSMVNKEPLNKEDLDNISTFIISKGMPVEVIQKIIKTETNDYLSLLDDIDS